MVNTAFALKFTTPCKQASKCGIYHLCFWFTPSLHSFASYLHRVNLCKSNFSCSEGSKEREKSDHKHKQILQELKKEKEWQRRTEVMISKQEEKIEELRKEVKMEIRGIMEEQNKHYEEMKQMLQDSKALVPFQGSDQAYGSLDGSTRSRSNPDEQMTPRKRRRRRNIKTPVEERSRSSTPEFYIQ